MNVTEFSGQVSGGVVVLDQPTSLAEGTRVRVLIEQGVSDANAPPAEQGESLSEMLLSFAGTVHDLPPDAAEQHDHYLYGTPKR